MSKPITGKQLARDLRMRGWLPWQELVAFMGIDSSVYRVAVAQGWVETWAIDKRMWARPIERIGGEDLIRMADAVRRLQG
jgi:ABC-type proline/glycine betaine transport system substrate-binding protein